MSIVMLRCVSWMHQKGEYYFRIHSVPFYWGFETVDVRGIDAQFVDPCYFCHCDGGGNGSIVPFLIH